MHDRQFETDIDPADEQVEFNPNFYDPEIFGLRALIRYSLDKPIEFPENGEAGGW